MEGIEWKNDIPSANDIEYTGRKVSEMNVVD
jgi:hypothetical protein